MFSSIRNIFNKKASVTAEQTIVEPVKVTEPVDEQVTRQDLIDFFTRLDNSRDKLTTFIDRYIGPRNARFLALREEPYEDRVNGKYRHVDDPKFLDNGTVIDGVNVLVNINNRNWCHAEHPFLILPHHARPTLSWEFTKYDGVFNAHLVGCYRDENGDDHRVSGWLSSPMAYDIVRRGVIRALLAAVLPVRVILPGNNVVCPFKGIKDGQLVVDDHYLQVRHKGPFVIRDDGTVLSIHARGPKARLVAYLFNGQKEQPCFFIDLNIVADVETFTNPPPTILPAYAEGHMVGTFEGNEWYFPETDFDAIPKQQSASYVNFIETIIRTGTIVQKEEKEDSNE